MYSLSLAYILLLFFAAMDSLSLFAGVNLSLPYSVEERTNYLINFGLHKHIHNTYIDIYCVLMIKAMILNFRDKASL